MEKTVMDEKIILKKYSNRRLYDTHNSRYVTLEDVTGLIKSGRRVEIIDAATKERERIQAIDKLNDKFASSPAPVREKIRKEIDSKKYTPGATAESISLELLDVVASAQAAFVASESAPGRAAAEVVQHASEAQTQTTGADAEAEASKQRVSSLAAGIKNAEGDR